MTMINPTLVDEVKRLLADGVTQRGISRRLSISRGSVGAIASGKRPNYEALRAAREDKLAPLPNNAPSERCPGCGGKQQMPCRVCRTRGDKQQRLERARAVLDAARRSPEHSPDNLTMDLHPEHQARYERLHASKILAAARGDVLSNEPVLDRSVGDPDFDEPQYEALDLVDGFEVDEAA
jgi:transcriptional regulator with XRE-family HTH domain